MGNLLRFAVRLHISVKWRNNLDALTLFYGVPESVEFTVHCISLSVRSVDKACSLSSLLLSGVFRTGHRCLFFWSLWSVSSLWSSYFDWTDLIRSPLPIGQFIGILPHTSNNNVTFKRERTYTTLLWGTALKSARYKTMFESSIPQGQPANSIFGANQFGMNGCTHNFPLNYTYHFWDHACLYRVCSDDEVLQNFAT